MSTRRLVRIALGVVAFALLLPVTAADAADQQLELVNTGGSITIGTTSLDLGDGAGGISGVWDDVTGDFEGDTEFNPITIPAAPPDVPVDVVLSLLAAGSGNVTGTIDPATGEAALTASMQLVIDIPSISTSCTTPSFDVLFTTDPPDGSPFEPLPFDDSSSYTIGLVGVLTVPALDVNTGCTPANAVVAGLINSTLGLPAEGGAVLPLVRGSVPPPTTASTSSTTSTTAATAAATSPRFTG